MIRIDITSAAYEALTATLPEGAPNLATPDNTRHKSPVQTQSRSVGLGLRLIFEETEAGPWGKPGSRSVRRPCARGRGRRPPSASSLKRWRCQSCGGASPEALGPLEMRATNVMAVAFAALAAELKGLLVDPLAEGRANDEQRQKGPERRVPTSLNGMPNSPPNWQLSERTPKGNSRICRAGGTPRSVGTRRRT